MVNNKEQERLVDVIMYVVSLVQSAYRFSKGQSPFDFEDTVTVEYLVSRYLPFIENQDVPYKEAHKDFLQNMFEYGWQCGPENFAKRTHPDLVDYGVLSSEAKEQYGFAAGIVCSVRGFYMSLKADLENEFMDSFSSAVGRGKLLIGSGMTH